LRRREEIGSERNGPFELLETLGGIDTLFHEGPRAISDEQSMLEGYRWIFSILRVALEAYVWADAAKPMFVPIVGPHQKWGGDNADAFYCFAPIDPDRTYRVRGKRGDAVYLSLTVYGARATAATRTASSARSTTAR
jgi:hypothetical protein